MTELIYVLVDTTPIKKFDDVEQYEGCFCYDLEYALELVTEGMRLIGYAESQELAEYKLQEWADFI
jgi:hypothetical protein